MLYFVDACLALEIILKVESGSIEEVLEVFRNVHTFIGQQIEDSLWNFVSTTREDVTNRSLTGSLVFVQGFDRFPHFVTFRTTVGFRVHGQILDVAEEAAVEVQVHGISVGTVGTLYQLSHNIGLVVILIITFYESVHVNVQFE